MSSEVIVQYVLSPGCALSENFITIANYIEHTVFEGGYCKWFGLEHH